MSLPKRPEAFPKGPTTSRASWASSAATRASMLANRPTDSAPELALRRALSALGLRCRRNVRVSTQARPVTVDLLFARARVVVFVDGCFWHACPKHATWPKRHGPWWREKLAANMTRDRRQRNALRANGWRVVRVWAHEDPAAAARRVLRALERS
jgi:DNA mismatch endonuclease (patch repair protein)